jgi:hypothetical protein
MNVDCRNWVGIKAAQLLIWEYINPNPLQDGLLFVECQVG